MQIILTESQFRKIINETPVLDKQYGQPLYNYLKQGERYQNNGTILEGRHFLIPFLNWIQHKATDEEWTQFVKFCRNQPKLQKSFVCYNVLGNNRKIEYHHVDGSKIEGNPLDWVKSNEGALYRIFAFTYPMSELGEKFYFNFDYKRSNLENNLPSNLIYGDVTQTKLEGMIHFTPREEQAIDIINNGFKNGVNMRDVDNFAYTSNIPQSGKTGNISFAYLANDIIGNSFPNRTDFSSNPYNNNFDNKVGNNASRDAVMFQANGVRAFHKGDKDYSCLFNQDTARNFVRIHRVLAKNNDKDTRSNRYRYIGTVVRKDGRPLYYNYSLTKVVKGVVENYTQYHKAMEE